MYTITKREIKGLQFVEMQHPINRTKATLCLNQGGRLSGLEFDGIAVLANFDPSTYEANYASSILFPFVNRIRDGKYTFENVDYVLNCNEVDKNNALHGLVYDKTFECVDQQMTSSHGSITLQYKQDGICEGFPFKFNIKLTYILTEENMSLSVKIDNEDDQVFPFTLGWHPYFVSENLDESVVNFESSSKYVFDKQQIISGTIPLEVKMPYQLEGVKLDDSYSLKNNVIVFLTPEYRITLTSSSKENYLQLYTPNTPNVIAIEPMTGAADSFNNKIGLKTLHPNDSYTIKWDIAFQQPNDQEESNQLIT